MSTFKMYRHPDPHSGTSYHRDEIIMTGYSLAALFFPVIWALWASLWLPFFVLFGIDVALYLVLYDELIRIAIFITNFIVGAIYGVYGNKWRSASLLKKKYKVICVVKAKSLSEAKLKFHQHNKERQNDAETRV